MAKHGRYPKVRVETTKPPRSAYRTLTKAEQVLRRRKAAVGVTYKNVVGTFTNYPYPYRVPAKLRIRRPGYAPNFSQEGFTSEEVEDFRRNREANLRHVVLELDPLKAIYPYSRW